MAHVPGCSVVSAQTHRADGAYDLVVTGPDTALRDRALEVLCSGELDPIVDMVLFSPEPDCFEARNAEGTVRFSRRPEGSARGTQGAGWRYDVEEVRGQDPLGRQDPAAFPAVAAELCVPQPDRSKNSYPLAFERIAQLFDHQCAPDLCVIHTPAHRWEGHRGEHGSLDVVQSRAPLVAAGAGVARRGLVTSHCAIVDVAPTILSLLGTEPAVDTGATAPSRETLLARQDGRPVTELVDPASPPARRVVVVLMDGANANVLYEAAAAGTAPNVARLIADGTALAHGAVASLPTVTLPNHTALLTGAHPGHHGILHNTWYDRSLGRQVDTNSPTTWQHAMQWLRPDIETVHEAISRRDPRAITVSINETADRGATYSTFDLFRRGEAARLTEGVPNPPHHTNRQWFETSKAYRWGTLVDASAVHQAQSLWQGEYLGSSYGLPTFMWVSLSLTDAAFHEGGPHSEVAQAAVADSDARLGEILEALERRGVADETAIVVLADHGMEQNAEVFGDWGTALRAAGVAHRDEASGFLYLGAS